MEDEAIDSFEPNLELELEDELDEYDESPEDDSGDFSFDHLSTEQLEELAGTLSPYLNTDDSEEAYGDFGYEGYVPEESDSSEDDEEYDEDDFEDDEEESLDERGLEERIVERLGGMLGHALAPFAEQQVLQRLGGEAAYEYLADLTPEERMTVAQIPSLARAIRDAAGARQYGRAPRSEDAHLPEAPPLGGQLQKEIDRAFPAYAEAFGVTKAQFTKMVLSKQGGY
jgi:hypothetical protein